MKGKDTMKTAVWILAVLHIIGTAGLVHAAAEKSPAVLFQEALYQEETEGDLDKAIELYGQVLEQAADVEHLAARSLYQLGMCHLKKGDEDTAAVFFRDIVQDYTNQTSVVKKAKVQLDKIAPEEVVRKIILPDADTPGAKVVLDLASGELLPVTREGQEQLKIFRDLGKGDLAYDRMLLCLRGAKAYLIVRDLRGEHPVPLKAVDQMEDSTAYQLDLGHIPGEYLVTTAEGDYYKVNILSANSKELKLSYTKITIGGLYDHPTRADLFPEEIATIAEKAVLTISTCAETDPRVKKSLESLEGIQEEALVKELTNYLDSETATIRRSAVYILWRGGFSDISTAQDKLIELCTHDESLTRGMAALALGENKVTDSYDTLVDMTLHDEDAYARRCGAYALGLLGNPKALPILEQAMKDPEDFVKQNAQAAITMLTELNDQDDKTGLEKAKSPINLGEPEATIKSFVKAVYHGNLEAAKKCVSKDGHDYDEFMEMLATESNHPFQAMIKAMDKSIPVEITSKNIEDGKCKISWHFTLGRVYYFGGETKMDKGTHQKFSSYLELVGDKWLIRDI